ncbi:MAG: hypothetical protein QM681_04350 [Novosphingobium sp.]
MRVTGRSKRTPLLMAAVALLLTANAWWFWPRGDAPVELAFKLEPTTEYGVSHPLQALVTAGDIAAAPFFDPAKREWMVAGKPVTGLHEYLQTNRSGYAASETAPFILIRMPLQATAEDARKAFLSLARQKICLVAMTDGPDVKGGKRQQTIPANRIVSVLDDAGKPVFCPAPYNPFGDHSPAAASSASM